MSYRLACAIVATALISIANASEPKQDESAIPPSNPLKGNYQIYGGTLSEMLPPTPKDRKIALTVTGPLARDLFNQIGPDSKVSCSSAADYRERNRGDLSCTYTKHFGYACYFGIDLVTGKGTYGAIC